MSKVVAFGEIMLRLSPPGFERLFQGAALETHFGGGEANVAVSLAHFGFESHYVTRLPDNPVGDAALRALRAEGVRTEHIARGGTRLGLYFAETGASQRPSQVVYDRAHSALAEAEPAYFAWGAIFEGAKWFHLTGITPALGAGPLACATSALERARQERVTVSFDLNYRRKLWSEAEAQRTLPGLLAFVDVLIANEEDLQTALGVPLPPPNREGGELDQERYATAARDVAARYGLDAVAITLRKSHSASHNGWSALLYDATHETLHMSREYPLTIVDRIGAGDSFSAGLIYASLSGRDAKQSLEFAVAASALKHSIRGDFNRVSVEEVERLAQGDTTGRVRR